MTEEQKDKADIVLSDEAKEYIDHLLETGNKEEFMKITDMFKEISENPEKGNPVIMGYDEDILREVSGYIGQRVLRVSDTANGAMILFGNPDFRIINVHLANGKDVGLFAAELDNQHSGGAVKPDSTFLEEVAHDGDTYVLKFGIDECDEKIIVTCHGMGVVDLEQDDGATDAHSKVEGKDDEQFEGKLPCSLCGNEVASLVECPVCELDMCRGCLGDHDCQGYDFD